MRGEYRDVPRLASTDDPFDTFEKVTNQTISECVHSHIIGVGS